MSKKLKKPSSKKIIIIGKKPIKTLKPESKKAVSVKKTVKAIAKVLKPVKKAKPTAVKPKVKPVAKPKIAPVKPVAETIAKPVKETPAVPAADFSADLAKSESVAATTIEKKEFVRTRRPVVEGAPTIESDVSEVNRLIDMVMRKTSHTLSMSTYDIKTYISNCNPNAIIVVENPRKDVRQQAKFHITVGAETGTVPREGYLTVNG